MNDAKLVFSNAQAITVTAVSENEINLGAAGVDPNGGGRIWLEVVVDTTFTADGAATLTVALRHGSSSGPTTVKIQTAAIAKASLTAGSKILQVPLPKDIDQYLALNFTVASGPFTAGKVNAYLTADPQIEG